MATSGCILNNVQKPRQKGEVHIGSEYFLFRLIVDDQNDTVVNARNKKYPLKISRLTTITYKESKKGRFRSLLLHDDGVGFMTVKTSKKVADKIVAQLLEINPSIEVKHASYL